MAVIKKLKAVEIKQNHLLGIQDLSFSQVKQILDKAKTFITLNKSSSKKMDILRGKTQINLFFEPSTRTQSSFELAGKRLGADVMSMNIVNSAIKKGETLIDTAMTLNAMHPDIIETIDLLQRYTIGPLSKKHVYQLYHDVLPEANVRAKYIKGKKVNKHNADLVKFVAEYYEISRKEAEERIDMYKHFSTGVESLTEMLQSYGKTEKEIKKLLK